MNKETKVIALTGCTRGLGRAMCRKFTELGHRVYGCGTRAELVDEINQAHPGKATCSVVDVTDPEAVKTWASSIIADCGHSPDYLLNNAAIINENKPLWEISPEAFARIIDVNLKGVFNTIHAFLPAMMERNSGVIINFSSGYGHSVSTGVAPYCCTKFGIEGLTQALAEDLPDGLAAIPMSPGIINTEMLQTTFGPSAESFDKADVWVERAVPFILNLGPQHSGKSIRIPG